MTNTKQDASSTDALRSALERCERAMKPFAGLVYNDNYVITVTDTYRLGVEEYTAIYFAHKAARTALSGSPAPSTEGLREWQPVVGWEKHYEVSSDGRIRRVDTGAHIGQWPYDKAAQRRIIYWSHPGNCVIQAYMNTWMCAVTTISQREDYIQGWMPLPAAPVAARTALAGVTAPQPDIEELIVAAYERGFQWCVENANDPEAAAYVGKAARDYADKTMNVPSAGVTAPSEGK